MSANTILPQLPFTGERMVPFRADSATELFHWQRYLFFRPWYEDRVVMDAASGEGYGTAYAANFASRAIGVEIDPEVVDHAKARYPHAEFFACDVLEADYSLAEVVLSFETIEHLQNPRAFLEKLRECTGTVVISTPNRAYHSPGNQLDDRPWNEFHTVEWSPEEFAQLIREVFGDRQVRFLSQQASFPGLIKPGLDENARYTLAVIGDLPIPQWPRIGLAMPTVNGAKRVCDAVNSLCRTYPGDLEIAVVANGSNSENLETLRRLQTELADIVHLIELRENKGYGVGANKGLDYLWQNSWIDLFGVTNDDIVPGYDCLPQLVSAYQTLHDEGHRPGIVGPVSNEVSGAQKVHIGEYGSYEQMMIDSEMWHRTNRSSATQAVQIRGLFFLMSAECLSDLGGFDPRFGLGNFEDDDLNIRCRLAGYTLWIAEGAFLHHTGSTTFRELGVEYESTIQRNLDILLEKWNCENLALALSIEHCPEQVSVFQSLGSRRTSSPFQLKLNGQEVDLVYEASDLEFTAYLAHRLSNHRRKDRAKLIQCLNELSMQAIG
jgi:GT2 family glycosyltransferase